MRRINVLHCYYTFDFYTIVAYAYFKFKEEPVKKAIYGPFGD
jgi:hypothetical protein